MMKTIGSLGRVVVSAGMLSMLQSCTTIQVKGNGNTISGSGTQLNREVDVSEDEGFLLPLARRIIQGR
jgi:hypothetical protein